MRTEATRFDAAVREQDELANLAEDLLRRCRAQGAEQAEVGISSDRGFNINVRMGEVETLEHTRDRGASLTVYMGKRKGSASTADLAPASLAATVEQACAIARFTEADEAAGLGDATRMATEFPDLDVWHPWDIEPAAAIDLALACEQAGRDRDARIVNADGTSVGTQQSIGVYANSHGFVGRERGTRHHLSCSLLAANDGEMQRDDHYDSQRAAGDMLDAASIGRQAADKAIARLGSRSIGTRECAVLFAPDLARGIFAHLLAAVSGGALYRGATFLADSMGQKILPEWLSLTERPFLARGQASSAFDGEGVATRDSPLVEQGVLSRYVLSSYSARKLGLESTANAGGVHNLEVSCNGPGFDGMLEELGTGLLVTEVMGQGVSILTGDYSRGAAGFWVENGQIVHPVGEVTIAGHLRSIFAGIRKVGSDIDRRGSILTGSLLLDRMTVAGEA